MMLNEELEEDFNVDAQEDPLQEQDVDNDQNSIRTNRASYLTIFPLIHTRKRITILFWILMMKKIIRLHLLIF